MSPAEAAAIVREARRKAAARVSDGGLYESGYLTMLLRMSRKRRLG